MKNDWLKKRQINLKCRSKYQLVYTVKNLTGKTSFVTLIKYETLDIYKMFIYLIYFYLELIFTQN